MASKPKSVYTVVGLYLDIGQVWIEHVLAPNADRARVLTKHGTNPRPIVLAVFAGRHFSLASDADVDGLLAWKGLRPDLREHMEVA